MSERQETSICFIGRAPRSITEPMSRQQASIEVCTYNMNAPPSLTGLDACPKRLKERILSNICGRNGVFSV